MGSERLQHIWRGALLHDIGTVGVPDAILQKPGPLTPEEYEIVNKHPEYAYNLLSEIPFLQDAIDIPYSHHEKWDGSGYPQGLEQTGIPLEARIFTVPIPAAVNEPGGVVTYTLELGNTSAYSLTLTSLVDNRFGNLDGLGSCATGVSITPGGTLACAYPGTVSGDAGDSFASQVTALGRDPFTRVVTATHSAAVSILDVLPSMALDLSPGTVPDRRTGGSGHLYPHRHQYCR